MRIFLSTLLALAMTACGGGGSNDSSTGLSISWSTSNITFQQYEGSGSVTATMTAAATGSTDKDVFLAAEVTGTGILTPIEVVIDTATGRATIKVSSASNLAAGTYTGTIKMKACANAACTVQHGGSPHTVNYTVNVAPGLNLPQSVSMAAVEGTTSDPVILTFNPKLSTTPITTSINYTVVPTGWLSATVSGNTIQLVANAQSLLPGSYRTTLQVSVPSSGQNVYVPVDLNVGSGMSVASGDNLRVTSSTSMEQLHGTIALALAPGANATTWYATSSSPFIRLDAGSGAFGTNPTWSVDPALLAQMGNNNTQYATITISTDGNLQPRTYNVFVSKALAEIGSLDTLALLAGEGGGLLLYGSNFSSLPAGTASVAVAGTTPAAVTVLSDKVLRVTLPAMPAGDYAVTLNSTSGLTTASRTMRVTPRTAYAYQALDTQGLKSTILWDAASQSVFVVNRTLQNVTRYAAEGGVFRLAATRSFSSIIGIAMTRDRSGLAVMHSGGAQLERVLPTTLSTYSQRSYNGTSSLESLDVPLPIMGDDTVMHGALGWDSQNPATITPFSYAGDGSYAFQLAQWGAVSGNGLRMIRPDSGRYSPSAPMTHADLLDRTFRSYSTDGTPFFYRFAVDHAGDTWAMNDQVVDFDLNIKGRFALPDGWVGNEFVLSRNGSRLYYYAQNAGISSGVRIYVFDTSAPLTTTTHFNVLGYIDLPDMPNCPYDATGGTPECYTFNTRMAIADDGQTLFVVGDRKFLVVPVPETLRSAADVQASALRGQTRLPVR